MVSKGSGETRILRYWTRVPLDGLHGWSFDITPVQERREDQDGPSMFAAVLKAVRTGGYSYELFTERTVLTESRDAR